MAEMLEIKLSREGEAVLKKITARMQPAEVIRVVLKAFDRLALRAATHIIKTKLSGDPLKRRTGSLARSIVGQSELVDGVPAMRVGVFRGPALKYAGVQEYGTSGRNPDSPYPTIVPKRARALAIPVNEALTPAGVARYQGPRSYPGELRFVPFRRGGKAFAGLFDATAVKDRGGIEGLRPLWLLLRSVDLEPRYYLRDGMRTFIPVIAKELTAVLRSMLLGREAST